LTRTERTNIALCTGIAIVTLRVIVDELTSHFGVTEVISAGVVIGARKCGAGYTRPFNTRVSNRAHIAIVTTKAGKLVDATKAIYARIDRAGVIVVAGYDEVARHADAVRTEVFERTFIAVRALPLVVLMRTSDQGAAPIISAPVIVVAITQCTGDTYTAEAKVAYRTKVSIVAGEVVVGCPICLIYWGNTAETWCVKGGVSIRIACAPN
jgi:hypothetical protein